MTLLGTMKLLNYGLVLIYGLFLSIFISGGWENKQQKRLVWGLCPVLLLIQGLFSLFWGTDTVTKIYPLITHIPLVLVLVLALKKRIDIALVSVCTAYLCCQFPNWVSLAFTALTGSELVGEISYTLFILPIFFLLHRFFVRPAHNAITYSFQSLLLFGSLPFGYYLFDYATTVYSDALYVGNHALIELMPTVLVVFYVIFLAAYHAQTQKNMQTEFQKSMLETELKQSAFKIESLRAVEKQTAIMQHDMRHHLTALEGFLSAGNYLQASEYIKEVQSGVDEITPKHYCENELVNLLCSSFVEKAKHAGVQLIIDAKLPSAVSIPDTELCTLLSNGLENALNAVESLAAEMKWIEFYCGARANKLLIEIKNPYAGTVISKNGIPVTNHSGHGYGCQSIRAITDRYQGLCSFESNSGLFTLRIVLPD